MKPDIDIVAKDMPLDDVLLAVIPKQYAAWLRDLRFEGAWSTQGRIEQGITRDNKTGIVYGFDVRFEDAKARPWGGRYDLNKIVGSLRIDRQGLKINEVEARHGDSRLTFKANTHNPDKIELTLSGKSIRFDDPIVDLLPADSEPYRKLSKLLADHQPEGVFDFKVRTFGGVVNPGNVPSLHEYQELLERGEELPIELTGFGGRAFTHSDSQRALPWIDFVRQVREVLKTQLTSDRDT